MPITHERFSTIVYGAADTIRTQAELLRLTSEGAALAQANAVIERTADAEAAQALRDLLGLFTTIRSLLTEVLSDKMELNAKILAEANNLRRNEKAHLRAKLLARAKRAKLTG